MKDENVNHSATSTRTSLTLLERVKRNESDAWSRFVDLYAPMIYGRCRKYWDLSPQDSENIGQDVFAAVARKVHEFKRQRTGSFRKWLRVITDNKCRDFLNGKQSAKASGGTAAREILEHVADDTEDAQNETIAEQSSRALIMRQAIAVVGNEFSNRDVQIFLRIVVDDHYRQDIAKEFNITDNTVYIVYSRVRKRLREVFEDLIDEDLLDDSGG